MQLTFSESRQGRGTRGAVGAACPHNLEAVGAPPPQLWTVKVVHFYFRLFLHMNLRLSRKTVGQIRGVFRFVYGLPWTLGDVCLPPPTSLHVLSAAVHMLRSTPPPSPLPPPPIFTIITSCLVFAHPPPSASAPFALSSAQLSAPITVQHSYHVTNESRDRDVGGLLTLLPKFLSARQHGKESSLRSPNSFTTNPIEQHLNQRAHRTFCHNG